MFISHDYDTPPTAIANMGRYLRFYNGERYHHALDYRTPAAVHFAAAARKNDENWKIGPTAQRQRHYHKTLNYCPDNGEHLKSTPLTLRIMRNYSAITKVKNLLRRLGLANLLIWLQPVLRPKTFSVSKNLKEYWLFKKKYKSFLSPGAQKANPNKSVLVVNLHNIIAGVKQEAMLAKALQLRGFTPIVLTSRSNFWPIQYYRVFGLDNFVFLDDHTEKVLEDPELKQTLQNFAHLETFQEVMEAEYDGVRVGKYVLSTVTRQMRQGVVDPKDKKAGPVIRRYLREAIGNVVATKKIIETIKPSKVLLLEKSYIPYGEIFSVALNAGIDVLQWCSCHKEDAIMLKRYTPETKDLNKSSLSQQTWEMVKKMPFTSDHEKVLRNELLENYRTGKWYGEGGTQLHTRIMSREEVQQKLKIDPTKKTAIIFSHIFWDETYFEGGDLFGNFEKWFVETVKEACLNSNLNWLIKLHPANLVKAVRDNYKGEFSEKIALNKHVGKLPDYVKIIEPNTDISTYSLFGVMDYCLTVRGTIGIEASSFGIPVITAGKSRYDGLGFTIDSRTKEEYLARLKTLHLYPALSPDQKVLAQKFAYATFALRPFPFTTIKIRYAQDKKATTHIDICVDSFENLLTAQDLKIFADWVMSPEKLDFLTFPQKASKTQ